MKQAILRSSQLVRPIVSSGSVRSFSLAVKLLKYGNPTDKDVFNLVDEKFDVDTARLGANDVAVKILAAPLNPADLNYAQGVYGKKVEGDFPAYMGNEGVAEVIRTGSGVKGLAKGDWVIPQKSKGAFGTWRQHAVAKDEELLKIPNDIDKNYAATIMVNPMTSYRLLKDFANLKPGDWIIQNGANSMVGYGVIQMAREMGINTINIIRSNTYRSYKPEFIIENLGGNINVHSKYLNTPNFREIIKELPPIKLALNCTGGDIALDTARALGKNGTLVTYGGMSRKHLSLPLDLVATKQLQCKGFWVSKWYEHATTEQKLEGINYIAQLLRENKLSYFLEEVDLDDFDHALWRTTSFSYLRKVVLNCDFPDRMALHDARPESDYDEFDAPAYDTDED